MVQVAGVGASLGALKASVKRTTFMVVALCVALVVFYGACLTRVATNECGVEQRKFGWKTGIMPTPTAPGLYFVPGGRPCTPSRGRSTSSRPPTIVRSRSRRPTGDVKRKVERYFERRDRTLGRDTHRTVEALNVQTSDGYAVTADMTLLYSITDPVQVARDFGWGTLYVDAFVHPDLPQRRRDDPRQDERRVLLRRCRSASRPSTRPKALLRQRFAERGFEVEKLLLRNFRYADNYEKSLRDKKVAVQLTEKNRKESLVNEEKAKLQQIESKGNATITIAESEVEDAHRQGAGRGRALRLADAGQGRPRGQRGPGGGQATEGRRANAGRRDATWWPSRRPRCSRTSTAR